MKRAWHTEGYEHDQIIAVGSYYFDVTENETLKLLLRLILEILKISSIDR